MDYTILSKMELERMSGQKNGEAICELGRRYRFGGRECEKNLTMAYRMYHKAERMNIREAFIALGEMYENGEYFRKNEEIAREYYQKAGMQRENTNLLKTQQVSDMLCDVSRMGNKKVVQVSSDTCRKEIEQLLICSEENRKKTEYLNAKRYISQAYNLIQQNIHSGKIQKSLAEELCSKVYWQLAFIGFNEQNYQMSLQNIEKPMVLAYHPWASYLKTAIHRIQNCSMEILWQDAQDMFKALNNNNLNNKEKGDILGLLGDLAIMGVLRNTPNPIEYAYQLYTNAANFGNFYAKNQLDKFSKNMFGNIEYNE